MSISIQLEIGHDASVRNKTTIEGFTHDWEVFVRGSGGTEIHHYIEKVVFHLHETFQKPRRVVKEPPFSLRTSGYAGFTLPIEIYLKNNQEPKKIWFTYELVLQPSGPPIHNVQKEKYIFHNPSDEFRSRLLKGGALVSSSGICQENSSSSSKVDDRNQMTSKPRLSGSDLKKQKMKHDEPKNSDFLNLFGPPITKTSKSLESVKPKDAPKQIPKPENKISGDKEKEKFDKSKSAKSSHKEREKEKSKERSSTENNEKKNKDEKKKSKDDKFKERERSKDKIKKERERSPRLPSHSPSPKRSPKRSSSPVLAPAPPKTVLAKEKEYNRDEKKDKEKDEKRDKKEEKKTKKDKRDHKDKDKHKERDTEKEHKEYKNKEIKPNKEVSNFKSKDPSINAGHHTVTPVVNKIDKKEKIKEKESPKESPKEDRPEKLDDKSQKHKHKKKDKKEKREERHTKCDKKSEKQSNSTNKFREMLKEPSIPVVTSRENDKSNLFGSPKSEPPTTPDQETVKTENIVPFKDDDYSADSTRRSSQEPSPLTKAPSRSPSPMEIEPPKNVEPEKVKVKEESPKKKEKKEKKKDKKNDKDHEKKRKRKSETVSQENGEPLEKIIKEEENNNSDDESKVSSTEDINPIPKSECDMDILRDLQHKIMSLKDNADLQKVVQLIAETGQYEVSANTFDFDLCLLDKSTVKQLQDFFSTVS